MRIVEGDETISTTPICLVFASRDQEENYKKWERETGGEKTR